MPWLPITEEALLARKMAPMLNALRNAALADGQDDPVEAVIPDVVARIRSKVASCATNRVDADTATIPAGLLGLACRMVIREAKARIEIPLTEDERNQAVTDERDLTAIARCELVVEQPDTPTPAPVQSVQPGPSIKGRKSHFKRWQQDGA